MQVANFVLDAINTVLDWDMRDEAYPAAVSSQVCLLAGRDGGDWSGEGMASMRH